MNLFTELKNRNVIRGAIAYAALAWLIIEVGSVVLPAFGAPEWVLRGLIILVAAGFIPALVLAWRFELTSKGVMTEEEAEVAGTDSLLRGRRVDLTIIVVLGLALAVVIAERLTLDIRDEPESATGLAVLPFDLLSPNDEDAYIAGGMHEELLTHLARLPDLRLISRTSMQRVAQAALTIPEIGQRLDVSHVVEGSIRRDGDRVRVTVQLIEAASDGHLWAENFERKLENLFALQSDVALAITAQLHRELSDEAIAGIREAPTTNPRAYDLYLQVIEEFRSSRSLDDPELIISLLQQALDLDPDFLQVKVLLAEMLGRSSEPGSNDRALQLVTEIREQWPDHILTRRALGHYRYTVQGDYAGALEAYQAVVAEFPNDIVSVVNIRNAYKRLDRREDFLYWSQRAIELSPEGQIVADEHVLALLANRRLKEAIEFTEVSVDRFPENTSWETELVTHKLILFGDVDAYLKAGEKFRAEGRWGELEDLSWIYYSRGDLEQSRSHLEARREGEYSYESVLADMDEALILRLEGFHDEAQILADRAYSYMAVDVEMAISRLPHSKDYLLAIAESAAVAGDTAEALRFQALANESPHPFFWFDDRLEVTNSLLDVILGNPEKGWERLQPWADDPYVFATRDFLRASPYHQYLFGDVAAFQEYIGQQDPQ